MVLVEPGRFQPTREFDCAVELLASAKPLKNRAPVHFHAGTAEIEAEIRWIEGQAALQPGGRSYARLLLRDPALLLPGDRFIIRMFSPVVTIGGGVVIDISPPLRKRDNAARLKVLSEGTAEEQTALLVREAPCGISVSSLIARTGCGTGIPACVAVIDQHGWALDRHWCNARIERLRAALAEFHAQHPLLAGMARQDLRSRELAEAPPFVFDYLLAQAKAIVSEGEIVRLATHRPVLKQDEEQALAALEDTFRQAGLAVPSLAETLAKSKMDPARVRSLLQMLLRGGKLIRISEDLVFHRGALDSLRKMLAERKSQRFSVPQFKDWTGISRKYAIPLLEYLDREHVTRREGDQRVVL
jgi:selenocysteine-specific elongation factor